MCLDNSTHVQYSWWDTENSAQKDCDLPILSIMEIPEELVVLGFLWKFSQGLPPRLCVYVCMLVGFRGQSPRSNNPPHLGWPCGPNFYQGSPPPFVADVVCGGVLAKFFQGFSPVFRGGVRVVLCFSGASGYLSDASALSQIPCPVAKFSQPPSPQIPGWARQRRQRIIQQSRGMVNLGRRGRISKQTMQKHTI